MSSAYSYLPPTLPLSRGLVPSSAFRFSQLIFSGEYTRAMDKEFHAEHFCCWDCDKSLTGQAYILREEHPYCIACYEKLFSNTCEKCAKIIGTDSKVTKTYWSMITSL